MRMLKTTIAALVLAGALPAAALAADAMGGHQGMAGMGSDHGAMMAKPDAQGVMGTGTVKKIDAVKRKVNLAHEPIAAIGWPAMVMDFDVAEGVDLAAFQVGQKVGFSLRKDGGGYVITGVTPKM